MAPGPITSWQIDGETMETMTDFIFLVSKITADGDCSQKIKKESFRMMTTTLMAERKEGLNFELESRLLGEILITSDMQTTPPLWKKLKRN